jgi:hypothetical protein
MTRTSVEELVEALRLRYVRARRDEKTCILNEFVAVTGYHRKAAIRQLRGGRRRKGNKRQGRPPVYTPDVVAAREACANRTVQPLPLLRDAR